MKKLLLCFATILYSIFSFLIPDKVCAQTESFSRVLDDSTVIYSDSALSEPLFVLPYSFYVKTEEIYSSCVKVCYGFADGITPQIIGYISIDKYNPVDYEPKNPYCTISVITKYSDVLLSNLELKRAYFNVGANTNMTLYGEIQGKNGNTFVYVYYNCKLGYLEKSNLNPFVTPINSDPIISDTPDPVVPTSDTKNTESGLDDNLQIVLIIGISVVSVSIVYFLFKPAKNKPYKKEESSALTFDEEE